MNFGYNLDNEENFQQISSFLDAKFEKRLVEESKISRDRRIREDVVHVALLFVNPSLKGLSPLEVELVKMIEKKCNLLICTAKCDLLNREEIVLQKGLVQQSMEKHSLKVFDFTRFTDEEELDPELREYYEEISRTTPFCIINSNNPTFDMRYTMVLALSISRYSDMDVIRDILFNLNLGEFKEITHNVIYEKYRTERLLLSK